MLLSSLYYLANVFIVLLLCEIINIMYNIKTEVSHSTDSRFHMQMKEETGGRTRHSHLPAYVPSSQMFALNTLAAMYELTRTSHNCGQRLPSVHMNFNAAS